MKQLDLERVGVWNLKPSNGRLFSRFEYYF